MIYLNSVQEDTSTVILIQCVRNSGVWLNEKIHNSPYLPDTTTRLLWDMLEPSLMPAVVLDIVICTFDGIGVGGRGFAIHRVDQR